MIDFKKFSKSYKKNLVFKESSFTIPNSKISFFIGPNGSGKTTLIKCMLGLEQYGGEILYDLKNVENVRNKIMVIWDDCPFLENLSGLENLRIFSENIIINKKEILQKAQKYLDNNILKRKVKTYSYGQKKKLALALLIILDPEIIIMDEISNGLDYDLMQSLKKDILKLSLNHSIILTGHQFGFYEELVDIVYIIKDGEIQIVDNNYKDSKERLEEIYERFF